MTPFISKHDHVAKLDEHLGLVLGFAIVCKVNGEDYYDLQGDHIPEDAMFAAATEFMADWRVAKEMHVGDQKGDIVFGLPLTTELAKACGIETSITGFLIGMRPTADVLSKFRSGEYTGFSIGGYRVTDEVVDKLAKAATDASPERRIMRVFKIREISAVDRPAQGLARAALMKRDVTDIKREPIIVKRGRLTSDEEGHSHLLDDEQQSGTTSYTRAPGAEYGHDHPFVRNDNGSITIGMADGHTHTALTLSKREEKTMTTENTDLTKRVADLEGQLATQAALAKRLQAVVDLPPAHRAYHDTLPEAERPGFLAKGHADRDEEIKKSVVFTAADGTVYTRFDDPRLVKMARDRDADRAARIAAEQAAEQAEVASLAKSLTNIPGEDADKVALVKAIRALPEAERTVALKALNAANSNLAAAFKGHGVTVTPAGETVEDPAEPIAKKLAQDKGISFERAYAEVIAANPNLYRA